MQLWTGENRHKQIIWPKHTQRKNSMYSPLGLKGQAHLARQHSGVLCVLDPMSTGGEMASNRPGTSCWWLLARNVEAEAKVGQRHG